MVRIIAFWGIQCHLEFWKPYTPCDRLCVRRLTPRASAKLLSCWIFSNNPEQEFPCSFPLSQNIAYIPPILPYYPYITSINALWYQGPGDQRSLGPPFLNPSKTHAPAGPGQTAPGKGPAATIITIINTNIIPIITMNSSTIITIDFFCIITVVISIIGAYWSPSAHANGS